MRTDATLGLTVSVDADAWGHAQRRLRYLEAVIVQVLRDRAKLKEWYTAPELAGLWLPGLPATAAGIARVASARGWFRRRGEGRLEYHYLGLPERAFDELVGRIAQLPRTVDLGTFEEGFEGVFEDGEAPAVPAGGPVPEAVGADASPEWLLPLMRIIRDEGPLPLDKALDTLAPQLPPGVQVPAIEDAAAALYRLGWTRDQ